MHYSRLSWKTAYYQEGWKTVRGCRAAVCNQWTGLLDWNAGLNDWNDLWPVGTCAIPTFYHDFTYHVVSYSWVSLGKQQKVTIFEEDSDFDFYILEQQLLIDNAKYLVLTLACTSLIIFLCYMQAVSVHVNTWTRMLLQSQRRRHINWVLTTCSWWIKQSNIVLTWVVYLPL